MAKFTVDPATLQQLSGSLSQVHAQMQGMQGVASGFAGLLGGSDLEGELEDFCGRWGYGITCLSDDMGEVVQRLNDAVTGYSRSEEDIRKAAAT